MHGYKINLDLGLIAIKYVGATTTKEIAEMLLSIATDPEYSRSYNILSDLRELTSVFSYQEIQVLADKLPDPGELAGKTRSAVLVAQNVTYGMGRIWASITENMTVAQAQVFRSLAEALEWLGLPPDTEVEFPF